MLGILIVCENLHQLLILIQVASKPLAGPFRYSLLIIETVYETSLRLYGT